MIKLVKLKPTKGVKSVDDYYKFTENTWNTISYNIHYAERDGIFAEQFRGITQNMHESVFLGSLFRLLSRFIF